MQATKSPARRQRQQKPQQRTLRILSSPTADELGVVRLTVDGRGQNYHVSRIRCDHSMGCAAFQWEKGLDAEVYHVLVAHDGTASCDCRGHSRHGHCKHASASIVLLERGYDAEAVAPAADPEERVSPVGCPHCGGMLYLDPDSDEVFCAECVTFAPAVGDVFEG